MAPALESDTGGMEGGLAGVVDCAEEPDEESAGGVGVPLPELPDCSGAVPFPESDEAALLVGGVELFAGGTTFAAGVVLLLGGVEVPATCPASDGGVDDELLLSDGTVDEALLPADELPEDEPLEPELELLFWLLLLFPFTTTNAETEAVSAGCWITNQSKLISAAAG